MPNIKRSLYPEESEVLYDLLDEYQDNLKSRPPLWAYAFSLGCFINMILVFYYFDIKAAQFLSLLLTAFSFIYSYHLYEDHRTEITFAKTSLPEIRGMLWQNELELEAFEIKKAALLQVYYDRYYLLETVDQKTIAVHLYKDFEEQLPFSRIEFYVAQNFVSIHLGDYFAAGPPTPLSEIIETDFLEVEKILELSNKKVFYKPLERVLRDCNLAIEQAKHNHEKNQETDDFGQLRQVIAAYEVLEPDNNKNTKS